MSHTLDAVFEWGVFRPLSPADADTREGQRVRLLVEWQVPADDILALATQVYRGLSDQDVSDVESIALARREFFSERKLT